MFCATCGTDIAAGTTPKYCSNCGAPTVFKSDGSALPPRQDGIGIESAPGALHGQVPGMSAMPGMGAGNMPGMGMQGMGGMPGMGAGNMPGMGMMGMNMGGMPGMGNGMPNMPMGGMQGMGGIGAAMGNFGNMMDNILGTFAPQVSHAMDEVRSGVMQGIQGGHGDGAQGPTPGGTDTSLQRTRKKREGDEIEKPSVSDDPPPPPYEEDGGIAPPPYQEEPQTPPQPQKKQRVRETPEERWPGMATCTCPTCGGSGMSKSGENCYTCIGSKLYISGHILCPHCEGRAGWSEKDQMAVTPDHPNCSRFCQVCTGSGYINPPYYRNGPCVACKGVGALTALGNPCEPDPSIAAAICDVCGGHGYS